MLNCPNCHCAHTTLVYKQEKVITYQNVLLSSFEEATQVPRGNLDLRVCHDCLFMFNSSFDENLVGYGVDYENAQNHSNVFDNHVNNLVQKLTQKGITNHKILEIGCGNGYFLRKLISNSNQNIGFGYDKSIVEAQCEHNLALLNKYYDESELGDYDVIISRHVVEHILDNNKLINLLRQKNKNAKYFIETPSLEWIIKNNAFYDIFYEHCSYFSCQSLGALFENNGIRVSNIERVFGDQYLWLEADNGNVTSSIYPKITLSDIQNFFESMQSMRAFYQSLVNSTYSDKNMVIWGAGAKGVTFANFVDPDKEYIKYVIDINPKKCGKFLPGSGHTIVNPSILFEDNIDIILMMNPNYESEIKNIASNKEYDFVAVGSMSV